MDTEKDRETTEAEKIKEAEINFRTEADDYIHKGFSILDRKRNDVEGNRGK